MGIMVCREPQVHGPLIFGMETVRAFGSGATLRSMLQSDHRHIFVNCSCTRPEQSALDSSTLLHAVHCQSTMHPVPAAGYWFGPESKREGPWVAPLFTAAVLFYLGAHQMCEPKHFCSKPNRCLHAAGQSADMFVLRLIIFQRAHLAGILTFMAGRKPPGRPSLLRNLITTYIVFTGVVEASQQQCTICTLSIDFMYPDV